MEPARPASYEAQVRALGLILFALSLACAEAAPRSDAGRSDTSVALAEDAAPRIEDAAFAIEDAAAPSEDASVGRVCTFNRDCASAERCACSGGACACELGARGTLASGVGPCATGDDCASALCVEGASGAFVCSGPCAEASECPAALPRCLSVPTVGMFCARQPAGSPDAGSAACSGACATTDLVATFGATNRSFVRAQHGRSTGSGIRIEAHFGGDPDCPDMSSPTPDRTLVLSGLVAEERVQTEADGVRASLFDFRGELTAAPLLRATAVRATPRYLDRGVEVSFEISATFAEGTIVGGVYAPHCTSLD